MPTIGTDDGVNLYYEETGNGTPIVFVHEFPGDHRSWQPMRHVTSLAAFAVSPIARAAICHQTCRRARIAILRTACATTFSRCSMVFGSNRRISSVVRWRLRDASFRHGILHRCSHRARCRCHEPLARALLLTENIEIFLLTRRCLNSRFPLPYDRAPTPERWAREAASAGDRQPKFGRRQAARRKNRH